jgi:magnesium-transporting ATPase (P-type)
MRVVEEYGLRINNANLTGEAVPARKTADASLREGVSEVERPNLVFAGTSVVSGTGRAVVYAAGMLTQFGRIARLTQATREETSPLQKEMAGHPHYHSDRCGDRPDRLRSAPSTRNLRWRRWTPFCWPWASSSLPYQGLPATITLALAMAVQRLTQRSVLVKKLSIVETLGTVSIICTDKSGTLTQNQMTVREIWAGGQRLEVSGVGYEPKGDFSPNPKGIQLEGDLMALLEAAMSCNNSRLNPPSPDHPHWTCLGDKPKLP